MAAAKSIKVFLIYPVYMLASTCLSPPVSWHVLVSPLAVCVFVCVCVCSIPAHAPEKNSASSRWRRASSEEETPSPPVSRGEEDTPSPVDRRQETPPSPECPALLAERFAAELFTAAEEPPLETLPSSPKKRCSEASWNCR